MPVVKQAVQVNTRNGIPQCFLIPCGKNMQSKPIKPCTIMLSWRSRSHCADNILSKIVICKSCIQWNSVIILYTEFPVLLHPHLKTDTNFKLFGSDDLIWLCMVHTFILRVIFVYRLRAGGSDAVVYTESSDLRGRWFSHRWAGSGSGYADLPSIPAMCHYTGVTGGCPRGGEIVLIFNRALSVFGEPLTLLELWNKTKKMSYFCTKTICLHNKYQGVNGGIQTISGHSGLAFCRPGVTHDWGPYRIV